MADAILGISAFYHDAAAALVVDGRLVAAVQEERLTRRKHDASFPCNAIAWCLKSAGLRMSDVQFAGFYEQPRKKFQRLWDTHLAFAPYGLRSFTESMSTWLRPSHDVRRRITRGLGADFRGRLLECEHHVSHAASAFFPSPFDRAAILTIDGVGERTTTTFGVGEGNRLRLTHDLSFPHSLGLLYSAFTSYLGFRINTGEYKMMGLAPYGTPKYCDILLEKLIDLKSDGSFRLNMAYFNYCTGVGMFNEAFCRLFDQEPRRPDSDLTQKHMDIAASIQRVTEEVVLRIARFVHDSTGQTNICMAGGVALNCVANGRLLREGPFESLWTQPAAGDSGGALGVALWIWHEVLQKPRTPAAQDSMCGSLVGPDFDDAETQQILDRIGAKYQHFQSNPDLFDFVSEKLASGNVVGWHQGRMEFGPRALGNRSILADPRNRQMQTVLNVKIKFRESFRPFAPAVLREHASDYFDLDPKVESPYMLLTVPVVQGRRLPIPSNGDERLIDRIKHARSDIPAVTHLDYSARVQTVDSERNPRFYQLLRAFAARTGCPVIVNTSFNIRGEPIVCTPQEAFRCFMATDMDVLAVGNFVMLKSDQEQRAADAESYRKTYGND